MSSSTRWQVEGLSIVARFRIQGAAAAPPAVPGQAKPSGSGINPCFLWDNASYMLGFTLKGKKPERTRESFEAFRGRHVALENEIDSQAFGAYVAFLRSWPAERAADYLAELNGIVSHFGVFRIAGEQVFVHDDPGVVAYWTAYQGIDPGQERGICLVTGNSEPVARLHEPKIKGVRGSQSAGGLARFV